MLVDSHCHLNVSRFSKIADDRDYSSEAIIGRAQRSGVECMLNIGTELPEWNLLRSISASHDMVFHSVGVHPLSAAEHCEKYSLQEISDAIDNGVDNSKCVAVGEIGLDYHYAKNHEKNQKELFELQMAAALKHDLPVSIHSRDAESDTIAILRHSAGARGVMHCFSGGRGFAFAALDLGFYISFSGVITFKNSVQLQEVAKAVPIDRLLIETDAPFLSPEPLRGKINEPAFLTHIAARMAALLERPYEEICDLTSQNFFNLFSKADSCQKIEIKKKTSSGCTANTP
ncbi:MAG: TatD family hydrolase [Holosporaceae bacterium]|jgi:TatD DNase family protein|nr:TatD family hydrolase [Holosporaceae bacterium]